MTMLRSILAFLSCYTLAVFGIDCGRPLRSAASLEFKAENLNIT